MKLRVLVSLLLLGFGGAWTGCAGRSGEPPAPPAKPAAGSQPVQAGGPAALPEITLGTITPAGVAGVVKKHEGKVVLVDFWATWCQPCKELFPHTVDLHRALSGRGLVVISVSLDDAEAEPAALKFLTASKAGFENYLVDTGASSESFEALGITNGALPFVRLYDRAGKLRKTFAAPIDPAKVEESVKELLAEPAPAV